MILLVDFSGEFVRNWFAVRDGGRAYDITIDSLSWHHENYEHMVICREGGDLKRKELYPEYKAHRDPLPSEALDALRACSEQIESWGVPIVTAPGYEADDVIATLAQQAWPEEVRILSRDKDLYQLINGTEVQLLTNRGIVGEEECVKKFGVKPSQMRDWLALVGDAGDNIPGCPNCGPGRARDLLNHFGSLFRIKAATKEELTKVRGVGSTTADSVIEWDQTLAVSLVTLAQDVPVKLDEILAGAKPHEVNNADDSWLTEEDEEWPTD